MRRDESQGRGEGDAKILSVWKKHNNNKKDESLTMEDKSGIFEHKNWGDISNVKKTRLWCSQLFLRYTPTN